MLKTRLAIYNSWYMSYYRRGRIQGLLATRDSKIMELALSASYLTIKVYKRMQGQGYRSNLCLFQAAIY